MLSRLSIQDKNLNKKFYRTLMNMQHSHPISLRKILAIEVVGRSKLQNLQILRNTIYSLTYITVKNAK